MRMKRSNGKTADKKPVGNTAALRAFGLKRCALCVLSALLLAAQAFCLSYAETDVLNASGVVNRSVSVDPTGRSEGFSAVLYNNTNGLPTSEANAIAETEDGFIWIGSYAGLIRYDGNTFERMDSTNGITSVTSLFVDSLDRLWIGTNANGVAMMVRGIPRIWDMADGLKSASVRAITEGNDGLIYVGSTAGIAVIDSDMKIETLDDGRISGAYIRDIRAGADADRRPFQPAGPDCGNLYKSG